MFSHSYCFFAGSGPDKVLGHSDLILRSHSASSIEELLSTNHSPPLGGSPYHSSSPFGTPGAYGCVPATASDDELQRSGSATPQDHRCAVSPPHLPHPCYFDYSRSLPPSSPHPDSRSPFPMNIGRVTRLQTTIGQLHSPFLFSSCKYHQAPSILDDLATLI
jgi:hypothetical protein